MHRLCRDELQEYWVGIQRMRAQRLYDLCMTIRVGMHGKAGTYKRFLKEMQAMGYKLDMALGIGPKHDPLDFFSKLKLRKIDG